MENKKLIEEIYNIQNMMKKLNSSFVITEQGEMWRTQSELQDKGVGGLTPKSHKMTDNYIKVDIGPGTDYPTMMPIVIPIMKESFNGPNVKVFSPGTTGKDFIKNVNVFKEGDLLSDGSPAPVGQEYIVNNDYKLCLPTKKWWDGHTTNKYVYQFTNPKNGKVFNLKLSLSKGDVVVDNQKVAASKAAIACNTNSNGWTFLESAKGGLASMIFYESKTNKPYNPNNPEDFTLDSDFDTWWVENSWWVEITVGVIAAVLSGGLATGLIAMAEAGSLGTALGGLVLTLSDAAFLGTGTSWLTVLTESLVEAALMTPVAAVYLDQGDEVNAILALAFSFLPFFTNIPRVAKYIRRGRVFTSDVTDSLLKKINAAGGTKRVLTMSKSEFNNFLKTLSKDENDAMLSVFEMITKDPVGTRESIEFVLKENADDILKGFEKSADPTILNKWKGSKIRRWTNPFRGRGVLPQFVRAAIPIGGIALGFQYSYNYLKSKGLSEEQTNEVGAELQKSILESDYIKLLNKLDVPYTQKEFDNLQKKIWENTSVSEQLEIIKKSGVIEKDFIKPAVEQAGKEQVKEIQQVLSKRFEELLAIGNKNSEVLELGQEFDIISTDEAIKTQFYNLTKIKVVGVEKIDDKIWRLLLENNQEFGRVEFNEDKTYKLYLGEKLLNK